MREIIKGVAHDLTLMKLNYIIQLNRKHYDLIE